MESCHDDAHVSNPSALKILVVGDEALLKSGYSRELRENSQNPRNLY